MNHKYLIFSIFFFTIYCSTDLSTIKSKNKNHQNENAGRDTYRAGYAFWYGTTVLREREWYVVFIGEVIKVWEENHPLLKKYISGRIRVHKILKNRSTDKEKFVNIKYFKGGNFYGLKIGDKVIVFLIEYQNAYALPDYKSLVTKIGYRLDSYQDKIVEVVKEQINVDMYGNKKFLKKYVNVWKKYDPTGVKEMLEREKFQ